MAITSDPLRDPGTFDNLDNKVHLLPPSRPVAPTSSATEENTAGDIPGPAATSSTVTRLAGHKGKLAIGMAATLGLMVYYGWRERRLAQTEPEEYARLQRIKAGLRSYPDWPRSDEDSICDDAFEMTPAAEPKRAMD